MPARFLSFLAALVCAAPDARGAGADGRIAQLPAAVSDLAAWRWQARPVLVFADAPGDPLLRAQCTTLEFARDGLAERDVIVLTDSDPAAGGALRSALGIHGFTVLLIGKDGGVKLRSDTPLAAEALFKAIDAMPMRRREMTID